MKTKIARLGVVLAAVLGLFATMAPPASATTVAAIAFVGNARLSAGLDYPCVPTATVPPTFTKQCPPTVTTTSKAGSIIPNVTVTGGNTRGFTFTTVACVGVAANVNKPKPTVATAGLCGITVANGTVTGFCGLSSGKGTATVSVTNDILGDKTETAGFSFVGLGGTLVITGGTAAPGGHVLVGVVEAIPVPTTNGTPTTGNSCLSKTAQDFTIVGVAALVDLT